MESTWHSCYTSMELEFSRQILEKYSDIKFMKFLSFGAELFYADRRMDGQT